MEPAGGDHPSTTTGSVDREGVSDGTAGSTSGSTGGNEGTASGGTSTGAGEPDDGTLTIQSGESLSRILSRAGLDGPAIHRASEALRPVMDPASIRVGEAYRLEVDDAGAFRAFELQRSAEETIRVERTDGDAFEARAIAAEVAVEEVALGATIETSLWEAVTRSGEHPALVSLLVDVFAYDVNFFTQTRAGDRFRMVVERRTVDGEHVGYGRVLAAEYTGSRGTHRVFWWDPPGKAQGRYVDDEGKGVQRTLLKTPLKYARVSSKFNPRRMHPVLHRVKGHQGTDYAAPTGTPVWAAADGKIVWRKKKGGAGNMVVLAHDGGMRTLYMHLSKFQKGQKVGQRVKAKTVIGYVGATGLATGPHLHFGVTIRGRYVDPQKVKMHRGRGVSSGDRKRFRRLRKQRLARLEGIAVAETAAPGDAEAAASDPVRNDGAAAAE